MQEYYLGTLDKAQKMKLSAYYDEQAKNPNRKLNIPIKKIDGINMPYVEIEMTDGTMCDLNNKPRIIKVLYVCYKHGKHDVYSLKETMSCEYEAIVLSPVLCKHPDYKPQDTGENQITCQPVDNAPKKPKSLMMLEVESLKMRLQQTRVNLQRIFGICRFPFFKLLFLPWNIIWSIFIFCLQIFCLDFVYIKSYIFLVLYQLSQVFFKDMY